MEDDHEYHTIQIWPKYLKPTIPHVLCHSFKMQKTEEAMMIWAITIHSAIMERC